MTRSGLETRTVRSPAWTSTAAALATGSPLLPREERRRRAAVVVGLVGDLHLEPVGLEDVDDRLLLDPGGRGVHAADELRVAGRALLVRAAVQRVGPAPVLPLLDAHEPALVAPVGLRH